jgi:hypothetical protein
VVHKLGKEKNMKKIIGSDLSSDGADDLASCVDRDYILRTLPNCKEGA